MPAATWATLDEATTVAFLGDLPTILHRDLRSLTTAAGLQYRVAGKGVRIRANPAAGPFFYMKSLVTGSGRLRADAEQTLARDALRTSLNLGVRLVKLRQDGVLDVTHSNELQYRLFTESNALQPLSELAQERCPLLRIGSYKLITGRTLMWRVVDGLAAGLQVTQLPIGVNRNAGHVISGNWEVAPAALVCFPLLARYQPLAMVVMTDYGAQVVMLPPQTGDHFVGNFIRADEMAGWPIGTAHGSLYGAGAGIYKTDVKRFRKADQFEVLEASVAGANALVAWLTDPGAWADADGTLALSERWITWASVNQAIDAIVTVAREWRSPSSFWNSLRALGILQGIWEGTRHGGVPLRELLDPRRVRDYVLPVVPNATYKQWVAGVIDNWQAQVEAVGGGHLDHGLRNVQELRHLVHGVGVQGVGRGRDDRLNALRLVDRHTPALQLILDMAVLWWASALWAPSTVLRPVRAPWE